MEEFHLNKIRQSAKNGELAVIVGSKNLNENPWQEFYHQFWQSLEQVSPDLSQFIEEIRERDIPCEIFLRTLYLYLGDSVIDLLDGFRCTAEHSLYQALAMLVKQKQIAYLGSTSIDNRLTLALESNGLLADQDYYNNQDSGSPTEQDNQKPLLAWLNGQVTQPDSIREILNVPQQQWIATNRHVSKFFRTLKKATTVLVLCTFPGEICWRAIYGNLLELAKKNVTIYWISNHELIPLAHITSICNGAIIKQSPFEVLSTLLETTENSSTQEKSWIRNWDYISEWMLKHQKNWPFIIAVLMNQACSRSHALSLFQKLLQDYEKEKNYPLMALCYRYIGKIFYEQGFMEKALEQHIKAVNQWHLAEDTIALAEEYALCGDNYWNGAAIDKAIQYYEESRATYFQVKYHQGIADVTTKLAQLCDSQENFEEARTYYLESIQARQSLKDVPGEVSNLIGLSNSLVKTQTWETAKESLQKAIQLAQYCQDNLALGEAYQIMGLIFTATQDYPKAREYYEKVYAIYQGEQDELSLTFVYCHLGHVCARLEDYEHAIKYYESSMDYYEKIGDWQHLAAVYTNLGLIYSNRKEYHLSEEYFARCEEIFAALGDVYNLIRTHTNLAKVYTIQGQLESSIECYRANIEMLAQLGEKEELASNLVELSMAYLQSKKIDDAIIHLQKAHTLYNSLGLEEEKKKTLQILQAMESKKISS